MNNAVTKPTQDLRALIGSDAMKKQFQMALPKVLPIDRFLRVLYTTLQNTPALLECTRDSVLSSVMTAAQLGLEIDPVLGRAYLIPFKKKGVLICQLIIGYKGFLDLAYRSGQMAGIQAEAVHEKDIFEYELGLNPKLRHIPCEDEDRGPLKYCYAVAELSNGGKVWKVLNRGQVMRSKKASRSAESEYSPWTTDEAAMWAKTGIRALSKFLPLSPELRDAIAHEDQNETEEGRAYHNAMQVPAQVIAEPEPSPQAPGANLTEKQELNTLMVAAAQEGVPSIDIQKAMKKIDKPVASMTDEECRTLIGDLKMLIRMKIEGVA